MPVGCEHLQCRNVEEPKMLAGRAVLEMDSGRLVSAFRRKPPSLQSTVPQLAKNCNPDWISLAVRCSV